MRILAFLTEPEPTSAILRCLDLPHTASRLSPARAPPQAALQLDADPVAPNLPSRSCALHAPALPAPSPALLALAGFVVFAARVALVAIVAFAALVLRPAALHGQVVPGPRGVDGLRA